MDKIYTYYIIFSSYQGLSIVLLVFLVLFGLPWEVNNITNSYHLFDGHSEWTMQSYFPYYLSVASNYHPTIGFPVFSGLSHEPHVIMYILMPAFFIILGRVVNTFKKTMLYFVIIVILLDTTSTTAIISFLLCIFVEVLYLSSIKKKFYLSIVSVVMMCVAGILFYKYLMPILDFINEEKIGSSSQDVSTSMMRYMFSAELIGSGNFPDTKGAEFQTTNVNDEAGIVGYLDIILFLWMLYKTYFFIISRERRFHYIGMAILYFMLHNLKLTYISFSCLYLTFILFIVVVESNKMKMTFYKRHATSTLTK